VLPNNLSLDFKNHEYHCWSFY